jgi:hypothetical protein
MFYSSRNISSIGNSNNLDILNAKDRLGSNLPFSIAFTVWRETSSLVARSAGVKSPLIMVDK